MIIIALPGWSLGSSFNFLSFNFSAKSLLGAAAPHNSQGGNKYICCMQSFTRIFCHFAQHISVDCKYLQIEKCMKQWLLKIFQASTFFIWCPGAPKRIHIVAPIDTHKITNLVVQLVHKCLWTIWLRLWLKVLVILLNMLKLQVNIIATHRRNLPWSQSNQTKLQLRTSNTNHFGCRSTKCGINSSSGGCHLG